MARFHVLTGAPVLLMIDNYDSFTYNVVQYLLELGAQVHVVRNDQVDEKTLMEMNPERLVVSPGPCTPDEAGISMRAIELFQGKIPILGVCLGHQSIGQVFGAKVVRAKRVMHGKLSSIHHTGKGVFTGLPTPFNATRYHSLVIDKSTLPPELELSAWTESDDGEIDEIMGLRHTRYAIEGVQFHPESIMSEHGHRLLQNFLDMQI